MDPFSILEISSYINEFQIPKPIFVFRSIFLDFCKIFRWEIITHEGLDKGLG